MTKRLPRRQFDALIDQVADLLAGHDISDVLGVLGCLVHNAVMQLDQEDQMQELARWTAFLNKTVGEDHAAEEGDRSVYH